MLTAIEAFRTSILRVVQLGGLHDAILSLTTKALDPSDILRAQIVLGVSALDYYIHEITVLGMVEVFNGRRPATAAFRKYRISMDSVIASTTNTGNGWFESDVRERHSFSTFQQPDKIADAIRHFSEVKLWMEVGKIMVIPEIDIKTRLKLIVDRRNKIAHEADLDPSYPGVYWPITKHDVDGSLQFISLLGETIHAVVT
ncbi:MAG: HEPN domain-containing protein [Methylobacter sp.]|nr:HEPN domain-containing protein [Methylobacter sp.]